MEKRRDRWNVRKRYKRKKSRGRESVRDIEKGSERVKE
jgi:hypothetical protein